MRRPTPAAIAAAAPAAAGTTTTGAEAASTNTAGAAEGGDDDDAGDEVSTSEARVLIAFDEHEPNDIVSGTADELAALEREGKVDPHPDAVAYARMLHA